MPSRIAVVGAGVSGLTTAIALAERGFAPRVIAAAPAERSASGAAAAIWYPYDAEPRDLVTSWAMVTYGRLLALAREEDSGVSLIEFRFFSRAMAELPEWAPAIGGRTLSPAEIRAPYASGIAINAPLMDTSIYLEFLRRRLLVLGGSFEERRLERLEDAGQDCAVVVNCTGYGARTLVPDDALEAHRGQVAIVRPIDLDHAFVSLEGPLIYVIPRRDDCVLGGSNETSESTAIDDEATQRILAGCRDLLGPRVPVELVEARVGLRPYRPIGVRVEAGRLEDGRQVVHNYGHGGAGFSLSWGCAHNVVELVSVPLRASVPLW